VDHGLVAALREDLVPWLEANVQMNAEHRQRVEADPQVPRFTVIFDREGYSPELFEELWERRIAVINYHRYPKEDWPEEEFREETVELVSGVSVKLRRAERKILLGRHKVAVRAIRKLAEAGRQISMVSTHPGGEGRRWRLYYSRDGRRKTTSATCGNTMVWIRLWSAGPKKCLIRRSP
jgi:hypothetical protein